MPGKSVVTALWQLPTNLAGRCSCPLRICHYRWTIGGQPNSNSLGRSLQWTLMVGSLPGTSCSHKLFIVTILTCLFCTTGASFPAHLLPDLENILCLPLAYTYTRVFLCFQSCKSNNQLKFSSLLSLYVNIAHGFIQTYPWLTGGLQDERVTHHTCKIIAVSGY